jgi:hypothetical protein
MKAARVRTSAKPFGRTKAQDQFSRAERRLITRLRRPERVQQWLNRYFQACWLSHK